MAKKFSISLILTQVCALLKLSEAEVLMRAGMPEDWMRMPNTDVTAEKFFALWNAVEKISPQEDLPEFLAMRYAHGPFLPPIFAFSSSDTVLLGLKRLAVFKPLIGPLNFDVDQSAKLVTLTISPVDPDLEIPPSMQLFEALYIVECARTFTGEKIQPLSVHVSGPSRYADGASKVLGAKPQVKDKLRLVFRREDADLPLISRSPSMWEAMEPQLQKELAEREGPLTMTARVMRVLREGIAGSCTTAEDVARRLNTSKRSLQRRLTEEGSTFQSLLNAVRADQASKYLSDSDLSIAEISHLLGFQETSSFFRAFHGWTGETPGDYREHAHSAEHSVIH